MSFRAPISFASSGDNTIIAIPANGLNQSIAVIAMDLFPASSVAIQVQSVSAVPVTTNLTGLITTASVVKFGPMPCNPVQGQTYALICNSGDSLHCNLGSGVQVSGWVVYDLINGTSSVAGS